MAYRRHVTGGVLIPVLLLSSIITLGVMVLLQTQLQQKKAVRDFKVFVEKRRARIVCPKQMIFRGGAELSSNRSVVPLHDCCENSEGNNAENSSVKGIDKPENNEASQPPCNHACLDLFEHYSFLTRSEF